MRRHADPQFSDNCEADAGAGILAIIFMKAFEMPNMRFYARAQRRYRCHSLQIASPRPHAQR